MKLIKPKQISGEIMTLLDEAQDYAIIVSPYYKFAAWPKLQNTFKSLETRGITVEFYVRAGEKASIMELQQFGIEAIAIPALHTKLYINEQEAIISSMNLLSSSDNNSLDIAVKTTTQSEYEEVYGYYQTYIKAFDKNAETLPAFANWPDEVCRLIVGTAKKQPYFTTENGAIIFQTNNRYTVFIANERTNMLRIQCVLSGKEYNHIQANPALLQLFSIPASLQQGGNGYYDLLWGTLDNLKSQHIYNVERGEQMTITNAIANFIIKTEAIKKSLW